MKVLHYAVFNDQKVATFEPVRLRFKERNSKLEAVPSKLSSAVSRRPSRRDGASFTNRACNTLREKRPDRRGRIDELPINESALTRPERSRAVFLNPTLAISGRRIPGSAASSVFDVSMYASTSPATGRLEACTP